MENITERQKEILMAIIREFMESADEVGSIALLEKYDLGVSSATIRNEMVKLMDQGLLEKSHTSSGRHPTDQALRLYVRDILGNCSLNPMITVEIRRGIFRERFSKNTIVDSILNVVSDETESASFVIIDEILRYWGVSQLFKYEELRDTDKLQRVINILEDESFLNNLVKKYGGSGVSLIIGEESGIKGLEECALAFTKMPFWDARDSYVGVIGSKRMDYAKSVPALREVQNSMRNIMRGWN